MQFDNQIGEVILVAALGLLLNFPVLNAEQQGIAKEHLSVALRNYLSPVGSASFLFLLGGFDWWIAATAAMCLLTINTMRIRRKLVVAVIVVLGLPRNLKMHLIECRAHDEKHNRQPSI